MDVVDFAYQVIEMNNTIAIQEEEIYRLKKIEKEYREQLKNNMEHNNKMHKNMLEMILTPKVFDTYRENKISE